MGCVDELCAGLADLARPVHVGTVLAGSGASHLPNSYKASRGRAYGPLNTYIGPLNTYENTYILPKTPTRFLFFDGAGRITPVASP